MAQLIKLYECISRYEWNTYRYPSQFIRLKNENWEKLYDLWLDKKEQANVEETYEKSTQKSKWNIFLRMKQAKKTDERKEANEVVDNIPSNEDELKQVFLNRLFPFQLKWATSTLSDVSFVDEKVYTDQTLKYFLQRFPDTYLLLYYPVFTIKKAPIEGDIILIGPLGIEIIYLLEDQDNAIFMASDERLWTMEKDHRHSNILSPLISLKRTDQIIRSILHVNEINFPIRKTVLSRKNMIVFSSEPFHTRIIGANEYKKWFKERRSLSSPLKNKQLKAAEQILKHCQSLSVKRPEWEEETNSFSFTDEV